MNIIGVLGLIGAGKDTIGDYLVARHKFTQDNLARPLKDVASTIFGWDRQLLEGKTKESRQWRDEPDLWWETELRWSGSRFSQMFPRFTPRVCLQLFGTDICRDCFHNDIWILSLKNRLMKATNNVVITDCRFPNECRIIAELGGTIIRVRRGPFPCWVKHIQAHIASNPNWYSACAEYAQKHSIHISEWLSFACKEHLVIPNDGTLDDLYRSVDAMLIRAYTP
jgi:hypothetical protein